VRDQDEQPADDAGLIERVAAGDRRAFAVLVERHHAPLYRYLVGVARDAAAAEDALQDAFAAAWRKASTFRGASSGRTWLYTLARNALAHRYRRHENRPDVAESLEALGGAAGWGEPSSGDRVLAALEDRDRVQKALARLSPDDREVLALLDVEELSAKEAAEALGIGVGALKSRLHRARLRLLAELGKEEADGG
jgi:RNA polymerase sigma-70 factor (ECF subfamily)